MKNDRTETRIINRSHAPDAFVYAALWEIYSSPNTDAYSFPVEFPIDRIVINHRITPKGITVYEIDTL